MTKDEKKAEQHPAGFAPRSRGLASQYAQEQGWGLNQEERAKDANEKQDAGGGTGYDYGARDFGDIPTKTGPVKAPAAAKSPSLGKKPPRHRS